MAETIRVLIVDDHALLRAGVRLLLGVETDIAVVGEAVDGRTAIEKTEVLRPDVVLMDLSMPGISGLEATREIKRRWPEVQVLVLTVHRCDDYFSHTMEAGASGYIRKGADAADLLAAVRLAHQGHILPRQKIPSTGD